MIAGRADVYWSGYYITTSRLEQNLFTVPYLSDVGLTLVMPRTSAETYWDHALVVLSNVASVGTQTGRLSDLHLPPTSGASHR